MAATRICTSTTPNCTFIGTRTPANRSTMAKAWRPRAGSTSRAAKASEAANGSPASTKLGLFQTLRPLFIGLVHGLAGSAAVALLVLSTIHNPKWAVLYLLIFGIGTVAGMMLITAVISLPFSFAGYKFTWLNRGLIVGSGVISLAFGVVVCYHIGFIDGLFTSHPTWTPS